MHAHIAVLPPCIRTAVFRISSILIMVVGLALCAFQVAAAPWNKCMINGTVTYQQGVCPSAEVRKPPTIEELNAGKKKRRAAVVATAPDKVTAAIPRMSSGFSCDGRKYCSQMTSCAEAKYFLANCPGVKMDGGHSNGIPCEQQWCTR
jgi:hypothetical protein